MSTSPTEETTTNEEVAAPIVHFLHVDTSSDSKVITLLALFTRDDLTLTIEDENEDYNPAAERRTRRIRTNVTVDLEASSPMAADMSAMSLLGFVNSNGELDSSTEARRISPSDSEHIEIAYQSAEGNAYADAELVHKLEDVEFTSPEVDMSSVPPLVSFTAWVHGTVTFAVGGTGGGGSS